MYPFLLHTNPTTTPAFLTLSLSVSCSSNSKPLNRRTSITIPARDRVIDFGRHKGKMLGSLPSTYLKWVSNSLRAGDFEPWARLADQVLQDPVYRDRIEWEFAENVMNGNNMNAGRIQGGAVSQLVELSERFGWDYEDKSGWSKVDFELLGTSNGGRIPRVRVSDSSSLLDNGDEVLEDKKVGVGGLSESEERRRERRMRVKGKKLGIREDGRGTVGSSSGRSVLGNSSGSAKTEEEKEVKIQNPFPGREALLKKVTRSKRFLGRGKI